MKNFYIIIGLLFLSTTELIAQISTNEEPVSFKIPLIDNVLDSKTILLPISMLQIEAEDRADEKSGLPPRFGYKIKTDINMENSGKWVTLPNGDKLWRLNIKSPGALSLNLLYDKFWLPKGAKFSLYRNDRKQSIGAFTATNNKGSEFEPKGFATGLLYSDNIVLEYYQPQEVEGNAIISIAYVVYGYRYINITEKLVEAGHNGSGACQVNVNCAEGANWQQEKNAVALILVNGNRYCSGSLINTVRNNNIPYLLTADHCLGGWANDVKHDAISNPDLSHWSFYWNYESPSCNSPSTEPQIRSTVGAQVVANNSNTDFALLFLTEDPKHLSGVTPYYLGWDRSGSAGSGGVGIHHPRGDLKKIATYSISPTASNCFTTSENPNFWRVNWATTMNGHSVTEGGSSGSPLINSNKKLIGQLYGPALCPNPNCSSPSADISNYGKFSVSWTGNGASDVRRRLDHWLQGPEPCFTPTELEGRSRVYINGPSIACTSNTYTASNVFPYEVVTWSATGAISISGSNTGTSVTINRTGYGNATLTATIGTVCNNFTVTKNLIAVQNTAPTINGPDRICDNVMEPAYYVSNLPTGASVSWSASGAISVNYYTHDGGIVVSNNNDQWSNYGNSGTLTATITLACGETTSISKSISAQLSELFENTSYTESNGYGETMYSGNYDYYASSRYVTITVGPNQNAGDYIWKNFHISGYNSSAITWYHPSNNKRKLVIDFGPYTAPYGSIISFYMGANSPCGEIGTYISFEFMDDGMPYGYASKKNKELVLTPLEKQGTTQKQPNAKDVKSTSPEAQLWNGSASYAYYPNPVNDELIIQRQKTTNSNQTAHQTKKHLAAKQSFEATLYNEKGQTVAKGSGTEKVTLNTSKLANGIYYLHYKDEKGQMVKKQIIVRH